MAGIKDTLAALLPIERGVYTGKDKPNQYCTFTRIMGGAANKGRRCTASRQGNLQGNTI